MNDHVLRRKVSWLIGIRAVLSTMLLGGAVVAEIRSPGSLPVDPFFALIAITYGLTLVYALTVRFAVRHPWAAELPLVGDVLVVSVLTVLTGGITSFFPSLYVLPIVAAVTIGFRRSGLLVATLSSLLYGGLVLTQYLDQAGSPLAGWLGGAGMLLPTRAVAQYTVVVNVFGFFAVALLSGALAEKARAAGVRLAQASSEIAGLQAMNQHVLDSLPSGLVTTDMARRILTFNHAASAIIGHPLSAAVGQPLEKVLQFPPSVLTTLDEGVSRGAGRLVEFQYQTVDGRGAIDIGLGVTHLQTPGGSTGLLATFQDVTSIKKLEREAHLQQRLAAVGEMAAGIAHEIRNPLPSKSGSVQILRQELPLTSEQEQLMDIVLRESELLNTTSRSFLAYARPQRVAVARLDVRQALRDTALLLRNSADVQDSHTIEVDVPPGGLWHEADENQIRQIVWNLATNGLRAMPQGGRLRLVGSTEPSSHGVVIAVEDEGIGIPPEQMEALFQPFHGRFANGSGLGLAIVHRIVTDCQGEVRVSSRQGIGTTVSVRLPMRAEVTT